MGPWPLPQNFNGPFRKLMGHIINPVGHSLHAFFVEKSVFPSSSASFCFSECVLVCFQLNFIIDVNTE